MIIFHILPMAFRGGWNRFRCKGAIINLESEEKEMTEEKKMKITKELKEGQPDCAEKKVGLTWAEERNQGRKEEALEIKQGRRLQ